MNENYYFDSEKVFKNETKLKYFYKKGLSFS